MGCCCSAGRARRGNLACLGRGKPNSSASSAECKRSAACRSGSSCSRSDLEHLVLASRPSCGLDHRSDARERSWNVTLIFMYRSTQPGQGRRGISAHGIDRRKRSDTGLSILIQSGESVQSMSAKHLLPGIARPRSGRYPSASLARSGRTARRVGVGVGEAHMLPKLVEPCKVEWLDEQGVRHGCVRWSAEHVRAHHCGCGQELPR